MPLLVLDLPTSPTTYWRAHNKSIICNIIYYVSFTLLNALYIYIYLMDI